MTTAVAVPPPTQDAMATFLHPPEDGKYELVDGLIVRLEVSNISSWIASEIARLLGNFIHGKSIGWVMTEADIVCFPWIKNPHGRRPDVAFFKLDRMPVLTDGAATVAPNIVVEVVSPSDNVRYLEQKVAEYLRAGVERVWIVEASTRTVRVQRPDGSGNILPDSATLTGEDVLTGFSVAVADLFPSPAEVTHPTA
ncbi:MAG TPA: Uma2 family endonuclease [Tepidisphaeraceae bacterium]|jgi:Uma2 family endonuclease